MNGAIDQTTGENFTLYHGDSCVVMNDLPDDSVDFCIHSPPFSNLYIYSDSEADMGNCANSSEFFTHYQYIIDQLYRVTVPGRLCVVHCKDLPRYANRDGTSGISDFPGDIIRAFCGGKTAELTKAIWHLEQQLSVEYAKEHPDEGVTEQLEAAKHGLEYTLQNSHQNAEWSYHSRVTVWKCPVVERERTNPNGLLHKTACRDRSQLRQGMPDYLLVFRKAPKSSLMSDKPVTREDGMGFSEYVGGNENPTVDKSSHPSKFSRKKSTGNASVDIWQWYADAVWWDINQQDVLNGFKAVTSEEDERHICPLQLGLIERCVEIWSNPGDVVFSPFAGIGSEGVGSLRRGRKFVGCELKESYYERACRELAKVDKPQSAQRKLSFV